MTVSSAAAPMRAVRGSGFAATALGLGVGAHLIGGGTLPGLGALLFLAVPVVWISFFLTRTRRRWPTIIASLLAIETGLHEGLSVLSGPLTHAPAIPVSGAGPMVMGAHTGGIGAAAGGLPPAHAMVEAPMAPGFAMVAAHLVATVLTGAALAYGEHLLWCLWLWVHHAVTVAAPLRQVSIPWTVRPGWLPTASLVPPPVDRSVRRRGPPIRELGLPAPS